MATVNSREIVDEIIANNGYYEGDPRVIRIVQYTNNWGGTAYGLVFETEVSMGLLYRYEQSENCHNPVVIFSAEGSVKS